MDHGDELEKRQEPDNHQYHLNGNCQWPQGGAPRWLKKYWAGKNENETGKSAENENFVYRGKTVNSWRSSRL